VFSVAWRAAGAYCKFRPLFFVGGLKITVFNTRFFLVPEIEGVRILAEAEVSYTRIFAYTHKVFAWRVSSVAWRAAGVYCKFRLIFFVCGLKITVFNTRFFGFEIERV
jgi:hypothetical protein